MSNEKIVSEFLDVVKESIMGRSVSYIVFADKDMFHLYNESYRIVGLDMNGVIVLVEQEEDSEDEVRVISIDELEENKYRIHTSLE